MQLGRTDGHGAGGDGAGAEGGTIGADVSLI